MRTRVNRLIVVAVSLFVFAALAVGCGGGPAVEGSSNDGAIPEEAAVELDPHSANVVKLLSDLVYAYETPAADSEQVIDADLEAVLTDGQNDAEVLRDVTDHWKRVYLDKSYQLCLWGGQEYAPELEQAGLVDSPTHAFVVLGYELKDGQMQDELKRRCEAAAAAARTFPSTVLVCSGGATGKNNSARNTEAGLMRDYLVNVCGIDEGRILVDERAMTTAENALNTMEMLRQAGMETMTIVTSSYHQRWGQAVYNTVASLYGRDHGYRPQMLADYSYDTLPTNPVYKQDARIAVMQIAQILGLPKEAVQALPPAR
ncbi:MAG: YdcF family protein [Atopobiaceae bacterium]|nr:YdcF family protein [Atopobiaceae bacterium]